MRNLRAVRGFKGYLVRLLCLILSAGMVLMGLPVESALAQNAPPLVGQGRDRPNAGQGESEGATALLLRALEIVFTPEQCAQTGANIQSLIDPKYVEQSKKADDYWQRLVDSAKNDRRALFDRLAKERTDAVPGDVQDELDRLGKRRTEALHNVEGIKERFRKLYTAGVLPTVRYVDLAGKLDSYGAAVTDYFYVIGRLASVYNDFDAFALLLVKAHTADQTAWERLQDIGKTLTQSELGKPSGALLTGAFRPAAERADQIAYLALARAIESGFELFRLRLPEFESYRADAKTRYLSIDLDLTELDKLYQRNCQKAQASQAQQQAQAPAGPTPASQAGTPPTPKVTDNTTLWVLGGLGVAAVVGGALALGLSSGGGHRKSSSSGFACSTQICKSGCGVGCQGSPQDTCTTLSVVGPGGQCGNTVAWCQPGFSCVPGPVGDVFICQNCAILLR